MVWNNTIIVLTRQDYNPLQNQDRDEWLKHLESKEQVALEIVDDVFKAKPLGCIAISQLLPKKKDKPMVPIVKDVLDKKFEIFKKKTIECQGYPTKSVKNVITRNTLLQITQLFQQQTKEFTDSIELYLASDLKKDITEIIEEMEANDRKKKKRFSEENLKQYLTQATLEPLQARTTKKLLEIIKEHVQSYWKYIEDILQENTDYLVLKNIELSGMF